MLWQAKKADGGPLSVAKLAEVVERQRRRVTIGLSCLSVAALALSGFTLYQLQQSQSQRFEKLAANQEQTQLLQSTVYSVASSPDGKRIVSGSNDKTIRIWDATTGQPIGKPLTGHTDIVYSVGYSPDGNHIVSGSFDKTVRIWDAATGQPIGKPLIGHGNSVNSVAYSPDGNHIVSGSFDKTIRIWDAATGQPIGKPLTGHYGVVSSVAYSPDGKRIVSGSFDKTVRIWDATTGQPIGKPLTGHEKGVSSVAFSPDGKRIVSGSFDKTIRIWDAVTGQPIGKPLTGHENSVNSVAYSPDGKRIISGSGDQKVLIWDVPKIGLSQPAQPNPAHSNNKRSLVLSAPSKSYKTTDVPHSFSTRPRLRPVQKIHSKSHHKLAKSLSVPVKALSPANNAKPRPSYMRSNRLYEPPSK
jgi:WD40 repeat protein